MNAIEALELSLAMVRAGGGVIGVRATDHVSDGDRWAIEIKHEGEYQTLREPPEEE